MPGLKQEGREWGPAGQGARVGSLYTNVHHGADPGMQMDK